MKGYQKNEDVRYALQENEIIVSIRDNSKENTCVRMCYTLNKEIDVAESSID